MVRAGRSAWSRLGGKRHQDIRHLRAGLTALLPRAVGIRRARQMSLTGEFIDAATALAWGIVNEVVAPEALLDRVLELAAMIAAGDASSQRDQMALTRRMDGEPLQAALGAEAEAAEARIAARRGQPAG
jgi:enoyl-CoA hydratase